MNWRTVLTSATLVLFAGLPAALACPFCETETGKQVQAGIFNDQFLSHVTLTLLPLVILLGIVALIYFDLSWLWTKSPRAANSPPPTLRREIDTWNKE